MQKEKQAKPSFYAIKTVFDLDESAREANRTRFE
jgi:hypothetical protein